MPTPTDHHPFAARPGRRALGHGRLVLLVLLLLLSIGLAGCGSPAGSSAPTSGAASSSMAGNTGMATRPAVLDTSTDLPSQNKLFQVRYTSDLDPIAINKLHTWTMHVDAADGQPVDGATVTVTGGMPQHNHGMPTEPIVTPLGNGDYKVEGMKFQMPGWWTVTVNVTAGDQQDTVVFTLDLQ